MHAYRFPAQERIDPTTLFNGQEYVNLPFGNDALLVYSAWQNHGVMPHAGGLLDQPRAFRRLLEIMGALYAATDEHDHFTADVPVVAHESSEAPRGFNDFMQRG